MQRPLRGDARGRRGLYRLRRKGAAIRDPPRLACSRQVRRGLQRTIETPLDRLTKVPCLRAQLRSRSYQLSSLVAKHESTAGPRKPST